MLSIHISYANKNPPNLHPAYFLAFRAALGRCGENSMLSRERLIKSLSVTGGLFFCGDSELFLEDALAGAVGTVGLPLGTTTYDRVGM